MRLDPGNYQFRSCAASFYMVGQYDRALEFVRLDAGSEWSNRVELLIFLRQGKTREVLARLHQLPESTFFHTRALEACYSPSKPAGYQQLMDTLQKDLSAYRDPEPRYSQAAAFNPCLGNEFTARIVKSAIDSGFCAYDNLQLDPAMAAFRKSAEYPALLNEAKQCRDRFLAERDRPLS